MHGFSVASEESCFEGDLVDWEWPVSIYERVVRLSDVYR